MNTGNEVFTKVYNEDKSKIFRIKVEWKESGFELYIIEASNAWFAQVTQAIIDNFAEQHGINANTYQTKLQEYLCTKQLDISFDVIDGQFYIFKGSLKQKLRFKYFFVKLKKLNYQETVEEFFDKLAVNNTDLLQKVEQLEEQLIDAKNQILLFEKKYDEFIELKQKGETQMYSAFTLILNEKKHKIQYLTELLEEYTSGRKHISNDDHPEYKANNIKQIETISESDSNDDNYCTDDEKDDEPFEEAQAGPSTSKDNFDMLGSDSPPPSIPKRLKIDANDANLVRENVFSTNNKNVEIEKRIQTSDSDEELNILSTQDLLERM